MRDLLRHLQKSAFFRPAIAAPIGIAFIFSFFSLSVVPQVSEVLPAMVLGIVNQDQGNAPAPVVVGDRLIAGMEKNSPLKIETFKTVELAEAALADGAASALLVIPENFSKAVMTGGDIAVSIVTAQHLSLAESQFGSLVPLQMELAINKALAQIGSQFGTPASPSVRVTARPLFAAPNPTAARAPMMANSAIWMGGFVGALMLFLMTGPALNKRTVRQIAGLRVAAPLVVTLISSLVLALTLAFTTQDWFNFLSLWGLIWPASFAVTLVCIGAFSLLGFAALLILLPMVFYQPVLSGATFPVSALPQWMESLAQVLPFPAIVSGFRSILIGGPDGGWMVSAVLSIIFAIALIWAGTYIWASRTKET